MAPISNVFRRENITPESSAFYLLIAMTVIMVVGIILIIALAWMKKVKRDRKRAALKAHRRSRHESTITITHDKLALLEDEPISPTESVPEIRLTFPEDQHPDGKRSSRIVIVKLGAKGSVGYEPYQEPLPVYREKESPQFQDLDLERMGGLREKEKESKPNHGFDFRF